VYILDAYKGEPTEQGFKYEKTCYDRAFEIWWAKVEGRPIKMQVDSLYRERHHGQEYLSGHVTYFGTDF
jgi:hypothetical protein